eukprot:m.208159 g.208159  ORF g.208159 m.208159 type:complete len:60 (+) comp18959_c0_seq1:763-942(+)
MCVWMCVCMYVCLFVCVCDETMGGILELMQTILYLPLSGTVAAIQGDPTGQQSQTASGS